MQDWSTAAKISIGLVLLAAICFILIVVMRISSGHAREGSDDYAKTLVQIEESEWDKYDGTQLYGRGVKAYMDIIKDKDMMALIRNQQFRNLTTGYCYLYGMSIVGAHENEDFGDGFKYTTIYQTTTPEVETPMANNVLPFKGHSGYIADVKYSKRLLDKTYLNDKTSMGYIDDNSVYNCHVIYDSTGRKCGVFFEEVMS